MKIKPSLETPIHMLRNYGVGDGEEERIEDVLVIDSLLPARLRHEMEDFIEGGDLFAAIKVYVKYYIPKSKLASVEFCGDVVAWCLEFSDGHLIDFKYVFESVLSGIQGVYDIDDLEDFLT